VLSGSAGSDPVNGVVFATMSLTMIAIGVLASYLPARRASSLDPAVSLRTD
jgi:ABC-type antimicrobial peptide transport system permease subunit